MSELLGSFGDNELSPECLAGAQRFLRGTTHATASAPVDRHSIMIPQSSQSFIQPVAYPKVARALARLHSEAGAAAEEMPHVVYTLSAVPVARCKPVFAFAHPDQHFERTLRPI